MKEKDDKILLNGEELDFKNIGAYKLLKLLKDNLLDEVLKEKLSQFHANDVAQILCQIDKNQRLKLYSILSNEQLSEVFSYLENPTPFVEEISNEKVADIIEEMDSGDAVDILDELDKDKQEQIFNLLNDEVQHDLEIINAFEEDALGSLITNDFVVIKNTFTVKEAMNSLVKQAESVTNITTIFVTDEAGVYQGAILLKDLFIARATTPLENVIISSYPCFNANLKIGEVIDVLKEYSEPSLPIVDGDNKLIGALLQSTIVETAQSEMEEDYSKLAGLTTAMQERKGVLKHLALRLPWLIVLLGFSMLVSALISTFDFLIALIPLLAFFQPLILGMSGNTGTQALGVTLRSLSQNLPKKSKLKTLLNETLIAFVNGLILAVISFVILGLYVYFFKQMPLDKSFALSGCIGVALTLSMTVSGFCGCAVPMLFKKLKIDPASASGPLITTASDLVSALTYYGIVALSLIAFI